MLALLFALTTASVVHPVAVGLCGTAMGARVQELSLGLGGPVLAQQPAIRVGFLPGGHVLFEGVGAPGGAYGQLPRWRRSLIPLAGPALLLAIAATVLGPTEALLSAARVVDQGLLVKNRLLAVHGIDAAAAFLHEPFTVVAATAGAKMAGFNLLPLPGLPAGDAIGALLGLPDTRGFRAAAAASRIGSGLLLLFLGFAWIDAAIAWGSG